MADRKKHHYVPKFYLRNFATRLDLPPKERLQINQLDVNNLTWRSGISLKDQYQKPYPYGREGDLEKFLGDLEGKFSSIIHGLISGRIKDFKDIDIEMTIKYFIVLSLVRLPRQQAYLEASMNNLAERLSEGGSPGSAGEVRAVADNFFKLVVSSLPSLLVSLEGLALILIQSDNLEFITSDNPVIRHNQVYRRYNDTHPCLGFLASGLQIFIPISPKLVLALFDVDSYRVKGTIVKCNDNDVRLLNNLQILNCDSSVYFSSRATSKNLDLKFAGRENRNTGQSRFITLKHATDPLRELIFQQEIRNIPNTPLSFMKTIRIANVNPRLIICPTRRDPKVIEARAASIDREIFRSQVTD